MAIRALVAPRAAGAQARISASTWSSTSCTSAVATTMCTNPTCNAALALSRPPVTASRLAWEYPSRSTRKGAIWAGTTPRPVSGNRKLAVSVAMATSATHAKPKPPPMTVPSSMATTASGVLEYAAHNRPNAALAWAIGSVGSSLAFCIDCMRAPAISFRSAPAQKCPPAPRKTTTRTASGVPALASAAASNWRNSSTICSDMALRASGRFKVICSAAPVCCAWTATKFIAFGFMSALRTCPAMCLRICR